MNENDALQNSVHPIFLEAEATPEPLPSDEEAAAQADDRLLRDTPVDAEEEPLSAPDGENPPADPIPPAPSLDADRLESLSRELAELKQALAAKQVEELRIETERAEFAELYPGVSLISLPDAVWEDVRRGVPLSAAYALSERRALLCRENASLSNHQNALRSAGSHACSESEYFSPAEVRAMSPAEVRRNYQKIMQSMPKWH